MGELVSLPHAGLADYFEFLYESTEGYVYSATKDPTSGEWVKYFFKWPNQKEELIQHVVAHSSALEVYTAPSLFATSEATKEAWLGSHVVWAEFDYGIPESSELERYGIPDPTLRIRSSSESHQHWYWKLEEIQSSAEVFESVVRRVAYTFQADLGTWNRNRVLRPPGTVHHESGQRVEVLASGHEPGHPLNAFLALPNPPQGVVDATPVGDLPDLMEVIAKYRWTEKLFAKFREKEIPHGKRSDTLVWLAYECATMGMGDAEILAVLFNADDRWKKFVGRDDRLTCLSAMVGRARLKYPRSISATESDELPVLGSVSFVRQQIVIDWVIENLLPRHSITVISSPPGVGKTQVSLQAAIHLALGKNFLEFPISHPMRTIFFSLEMPADNLHYFMNQMFHEYEDETDLELLENNLLVVPLGYALRFNNPVEQQRLLDVMDKFKPDGIVIDSLGSSVTGINDDEVINQTFDFYKRRVINDFNAFVWVIHHFRKAQIGNKKPNTLDDLIGSQYIGSMADLVLSLWKENKDDAFSPLSVKALKPRMGVGFDEFFIQRSEWLSFGKVDQNGRPIPTNDSDARADTSQGSL